MGQIAETLIERLADWGADTVFGLPGDSEVLADGFSCRTQIAELDSGGRTAMHLAELLASGRPARIEP
jgi:hypothetical protein